MFEVLPRAVTMYSDGSPFDPVTWDSFELPEGNLYLSPEADASLPVPDILLGQLGKGAIVGSGVRGGIVYAAPQSFGESYVVKEFDDAPPPRGIAKQKAGLPSLRATVALEKGLDQIDQSQASWKFRGVKVLGAYVPRDESEGRPERWLMERVNPVSPAGRYNPGLAFVIRWPAMPPSRKRIELYKDAMLRGSFVSSPGFVSYDDVDDNLLIERTPQRSRGGGVAVQGSAVKIDIEAVNGFNYY